MEGLLKKLLQLSELQALGTLPGQDKLNRASARFW